MTASRWWRWPRPVRAAVGLGFGAVSAVVEAVLLAGAAVLMAYSLAFSRGRRSVPEVVASWAVAVSQWEIRRLARCYGYDRQAEPGPLRALAYLVLRVPVGLLGGLILGLIGYGIAAGVRLAWGWWGPGTPLDGIPATPLIVTYIGVAGVVLLFLAIQGLVGVVALERKVAWRALGPSPLEEYERRIAQLSVTRAEVVDAIDDERRRIERDLHDGVQQRLVALGMLIGRARRSGDEERAKELLKQAHEESQQALQDLREVAWRIYPAALDREGLRAALETVAERSVLPVSIDYDVPGPLAHATETAAYFVVCEAVTNAAKHSGASEVDVRVAGDGKMIGVRIRDDGSGGADPRGSGLAGLARRVAALDGTFIVVSPEGGPTMIFAELPCE